MLLFCRSYGSVYTPALHNDGCWHTLLVTKCNRRDVVKDPSDNVTACEEFFILRVKAHIVAAAMTVFGMTSIDEKPSVMFFPDESHSLDHLQRHNILLLALR